VSVALDVEVTLAHRSVRQDIEIDVRVRVHPSLTPDLTVTADVEPVARDDIDVRGGGGVTGLLLRRLGLDEEVRAGVVDHVRDLLATPPAQAACRIDLTEFAERAWDSGLVLLPAMDPAEDVNDELLAEDPDRPHRSEQSGPS
jgi:hypothetical protein